MGAAEEKVPLVGEMPAVAKEPRQWKAGVFSPLGDCGASDAAACCLVFNAPHVAFGWNASRGLGLTWWKEALKLCLLTAGAFAVIRLAVVILVHTSCHPHAMPHKDQLMASSGISTALGSAEPNHPRGHWDTAVMDPQFDVDRHEFWHHPHQHDDAFDMHLTPDELEECVGHIAPALVALLAFGIACFVYAAYFAALRRKMLRERFGIEGTFRNDWLLWAMCGPCALTQETRTLMHNNVDHGMWHGPHQAPAQVGPMAV